MAKVTISSELVRDPTGRQDNRPWYVFGEGYQPATDGLVTPRRSRPIYPVAGTLSFEVEAGKHVWIENPSGDQYYVTIGDEDQDLEDLLATAVGVPPDSSQDLLDAAVETFVENNPGYPWSGVADKPPVIAAGATAEDALIALSATVTGRSLLWSADAAGARGVIGAVSKRDYDDLLVGVGCADLDTFLGADDDAKLAAALSYAAAQTHRPAIRFPARAVTLNVGGLVPFDGMKLIGPYGSDGPKNIGVNGTMNTHRINVGVGHGTDSLFNGAGLAVPVYDIQVRDLAFKATNTGSQFWHQPTGTASIYAAAFHSLTFENFKHVIGNPTNLAYTTQVLFTGHWQVLQGYDTQFNVDGSDNDFWGHGYLNIGSTQSVGPGVYLMMWEGVSKTKFGHIYATVSPGWKAMRCKNFNGLGGVSFHACTFEGLPGTPATTQLIDITETGSALGSWSFFACMFNHVNGGNGAIVQSGGRLNVYAPTYKRYSGAAETFPLLYQTGGVARIHDAVAATAGEHPYARWSDASVTKLAAANGVQPARPVAVSVTTATVLAADPGTAYVVYVGSGGAPTLPPSATAAAGANRYTICNTHTAARTVACSGAETINGSTTVSLPIGASIDVYSDGTNWRIV